jgi:hypothetical protein
MQFFLQFFPVWPVPRASPNPMLILMLFKFNMGIFYVLYSTLLHLQPLRFHWVGGCFDRTSDFCVLAVRLSNYSARSQKLTWLSFVSFILLNLVFARSTNSVYFYSAESTKMCRLYRERATPLIISSVESHGLKRGIDDLYYYYTDWVLTAVRIIRSPPPSHPLTALFAKVEFASPNF